MKMNIAVNFQVAHPRHRGHPAILQPERWHRSIAAYGGSVRPSSRRGTWAGFNGARETGWAYFLSAGAVWEGYPTVCESMIFCSGRRCRALASASRSTMARITVEKHSEAQYRYTFCPMKPVSAAEYNVFVRSGVSAILA